LTGFSTFIASTEVHGPRAWWVPIFWLGVAFLLILVLGRIAVAGAKESVPKNPLTQLAEHAYLFIENMCVGVIGPHGKRYVPLVFTIWSIVLFSNLLGFFGLFAPTSVLGLTLGMAILVVFYVQWEGIKANGPLGYVKHFFGPPLGKWLLPVTVLLFVIEIISEAAKMLSLSIRLYGNISGEHEVGSTLGGLIPISEKFAIPVQVALLPLGLFVSLVQALVFTILTCVYLSLMTYHDAEHGPAEHVH
jgi:F-type H+-transporting ATPase subunit a